MTKQYRIVRRYDRGKNMAVTFSYIIQYLGINYWKSFFFFTKWLEWKDYGELEAYGTDVCWALKEFSGYREAWEYMQNLKKVVPGEEVIVVR